MFIRHLGWRRSLRTTRSRH